MITRRFDWKPDVPDFRDFAYSRTIGAIPPAALPDRVDLRAKCSPVEDQGDLGSCTAHATAALLEFDSPGFNELDHYSRLFIYYQARKMEGTIRSDDGAYLRDCAKACAKIGAPNEKLWPYNVAKFAVAPPVVANLDAAKRKVKTYARLASLKDMQATLASGFPFMFGFAVYDSFMADDVTRSGVMSMPDPSERMLGGHAVAAVGYELDHLIVRNSWSATWGDHGYFYMPFAYVKTRELSDDFWSLRWR